MSSTRTNPVCQPSGSMMLNRSTTTNTVNDACPTTKCTAPGRVRGRGRPRSAARSTAQWSRRRRTRGSPPSTTPNPMSGAERRPATRSRPVPNAFDRSTLSVPDHPERVVDVERLADRHRDGGDRAWCARRPGSAPNRGSGDSRVSRQGKATLAVGEVRNVRSACVRFTATSRPTSCVPLKSRGVRARGEHARGATTPRGELGVEPFDDRRWWGGRHGVMHPALVLGVHGAGRARQTPRRGSPLRGAHTPTAVRAAATASPSARSAASGVALSSSANCTARRSSRTNATRARSCAAAPAGRNTAPVASSSWCDATGAVRASSVGCVSTVARCGDVGGGSAGDGVAAQSRPEAPNVAIPQRRPRRAPSRRHVP